MPDSKRIGTRRCARFSGESPSDGLEKTAAPYAPVGMVPQFALHTALLVSVQLFAAVVHIAVSMVLVSTFGVVSRGSYLKFVAYTARLCGSRAVDDGVLRSRTDEMVSMEVAGRYDVCFTRWLMQRAFTCAAPCIAKCREQLAGCGRAHVTVPPSLWCYLSFRLWWASVAVGAGGRYLNEFFPNGADLVGIQFIAGHADPGGKVPGYSVHKDVPAGMTARGVLLELEDLPLGTGIIHGRGEMHLKTSAFVFDTGCRHFVPKNSTKGASANEELWDRTRVFVLLADGLDEETDVDRAADEHKLNPILVTRKPLFP